MIKYQDLIQRIYKKFNVEKEILNIIYNNTDEAKFVYNEFTEKTMLSKEYLKVIS